MTWKQKAVEHPLYDPEEIIMVILSVILWLQVPVAFVLGLVDNLFYFATPSVLMVVSFWIWLS